MVEIAFEYSGKENFLSRLNPAFKLLYLILLSILISTANGAELYIHAIFLILIGAIARINLIKLILKLPVMIIIALFIAISEYINTKSINSTIEESFTFLTLILVTILFMTTTDVTELASSIGHYLSPVFGKKAWSLASSVMITLALLPMIFSSSTIMLQSRRARGGSFLSHPIKNLSDYIISLLSILFKKSIIFEDALLSRAYTSDTRRHAKVATKYDILILICLILLTISIFLLRRN